MMHIKITLLTTYSLAGLPHHQSLLYAFIQSVLVLSYEEFRQHEDIIG